MDRAFSERSDRSNQPRQVRRAIAACAAILAGLAWAVLIVPVSSQALRSAAGAISLPHPLALVVRKLPILFPLHMGTSACALFLVPMALASWRVPAFHRWIGRVAALFIVVGGSTALVVAVESAATPAARAGFFCQGVVWLALMGAGLFAIRQNARAWHIRFMTATALITVSPVVLRVLLHLAVASRLPFNRTYAFLAWGAWLVPLAIYGIIGAVRLLRPCRAQLDGALQVAAPTYLKSTVIGYTRELKSLGVPSDAG